MPSRTQTMPTQTTTKSYSYASRSNSTYLDQAEPRRSSKSKTARPVPSRSTSTDSSTSTSRSTSTSTSTSSSSSDAIPDFAGLPPNGNAYGIMSDWELESLDKWQRRLEQVRYDQTVLRSRIDALRKQEQSLWSAPRRSSSSRSTKNASPSGGGVGGADYGELAHLLSTEIVSLQAELFATAESEEKAKSGIRKATTRLERLRALEGRWKVPSPSSSPPRSRSTSPIPPQPRLHRKGPATTTSAPPPPKQPTRKPSMRTFERPPAPKAPEPTLPKPIRVTKPLQPASRAASLDPWLSYEDRWHQLQTNPSGAPIRLHFSTVPWPMAIQPTSVDAINTTEIKEFILSSRAIRAAGLRKDRDGDRDNWKVEHKERKAMLRSAILRWHPDKFLSKFLGWVDEEERADVKEGVGKVIRCLNEIMRYEDARAKLH